jgi:archaellum biogenesis protein FlaJ (TadC family)
MLEVAVAGLDAGTATPSGISMPMFNTPNVELFRVTILAMIILFSVINAFSISATDGGHKTKISFYLSLMLILSGLCMLFLPSVVEGFLQLQ